MQTSYVSISQQTVLSRMMDIISNNIANMGTTAFKLEQPLFKEFKVNAGNGQTVSYVQDAGTFRDTAQGDLTETGNPLDLGIQGSGYFQVQTADGTRYTRNGKFQIGPSRQLVTLSGDAILSDRSVPITIPAGAGIVTISKDGTVAASNGGTLGKIALVKFANQQSLLSSANGLYVTDSAGLPDTDSQIRQGTVEQSNVKPIVELTQLLDSQRAYTNAQQMVTDEDTRIRNAIDKLTQSVG